MKLNSADRDDRRLGQRHDHLPQDLQLAAAVHPHRVGQLLGMVMKNWRSRKIEKASPKKLGMISGLSVPMNWIPVHSWNCLAHRM